MVLPGQAAPEAVYFFEKGEHLPALDGASEMNTFERAFVTQNVHRVRTFKLVAIGALAIIAIGVRLMWRWNIQTSRMRHENPEDKLQDIRHQRHAPHQFGATLLHEVFQRSVATRVCVCVSGGPSDMVRTTWRKSQCRTRLVGGGRALLPWPAGRP